MNKTIMVMAMIAAVAHPALAAEFGDLSVKASALKESAVNVAVPLKPVAKIAKGVDYLVAHTEEQAAFGNLSLVRSVLQVYYGDHEGVFPTRLEELVSPEYLRALPEIKLPGQVRSNKVITVFKVETGKKVCDLVTNEGGYLYIADKSAKDLYGFVIFNSSAMDLKGKAKYCEY